MEDRQTLTDEMGILIFIEAHRMLERKKKRGMIRSDRLECEVILSTDFENTALSGMSGVLFKVSASSNAGKTEAEIIVRRSDYTAEELKKLAVPGMLIRFGTE